MSPFNYFFQFVKCFNEREIAAMYSDLKQIETLQASLPIQNLKSLIFFFTDLEKEEYVTLFSGTSLNTFSSHFQRVSFSGNKQLCNNLCLNFGPFRGILGSPTKLIRPVAIERLVQLCLFMSSECSTPHIV